MNRTRPTSTPRRTPVLVLALTLLLAACDKMPMNGALDGMWQLTCERRPDGTERTCRDDGLYVSFQLHTAQWSTRENPTLFYARFTHSADSLRFGPVCHNSENATAADDNVPLTADELPLLAPFGMHATQPAFRVITLNHHHLVLEDQGTRLTFRKF